MKAITMMKRIAATLLATVGLAQAATPVTTYFHNDLAGSPVAATNEAGQVIWREGYYPYGERMQKPLTDNKVWFTARREDPETGLVYMGARYYDPVAGRFIQPDPVHFVDSNVHSFNRYAYANNNPYKYVDPDGRQAVPPLRPPPSTGATLQLGVLGKPSQAQQIRQLEGFASGPPMPTLSAPGFTSAVVDFALGGMPGVVKGVVSNLIFNESTGAAQKLGRQLGSQEGVAELVSGGGKAIAGAGTKVPLRDVDRLVNEYGGDAAQWAKVTSTAEGHVQTHAYRNVATGQVVEPKSIVP